MTSVTPTPSPPAAGGEAIAPSIPGPAARPLSAWAVPLALIVLTGIAIPFDARLAGALRVADPEKLQLRDWWRLLRVMGYVPTWLVIAGALALGALAVARAGFFPGAARRLLWGAARLVAATLVAGALAELVKRLVARARPTSSGLDTYRPFPSGFLDDSNLSMPSSHAAVAFGAAWMAWRLCPAPGALALLMAAGCGLSRLLVGAHYLGDVLAGALIGYAGAWGASLLPGGARRGEWANRR